MESTERPRFPPGRCDFSPSVLETGQGPPVDIAGGAPEMGKVWVELRQTLRAVGQATVLLSIAEVRPLILRPGSQRLRSLELRPAETPTHDVPQAWHDLA